MPPDAQQSEAKPPLRAPSSAEDTRKPFKLGYQPSLDGLRGVAVLLVLGCHFKLFPGGSFGVDVFFVLSGFLITTLLVEEWQRRSAISLRRFYFRRGLRLLPALFALLLVEGIYTHLFRAPAEAASFRREALLAVCYVSNWPALHRTDLPTLAPTWSLAVEEQFYLIWPIILYGLLRCRLSSRALVWGVFVAVVAAAGHRALLFADRPPHGPERDLLIERLYMGLDTRADALLVGCLIGLLVTGNLLPQSKWFRQLVRVEAGLAVSGMAYVVGYSCYNHHLFYNGGYTLVALMVGAILVCLLTAPPAFATVILSSRLLVGVGRISYALYLFHMPLQYWIAPRQLGWSLGTLIVVSISVAFAVLSYYAIERPCLRLKSRLGAHASKPDTARGTFEPEQVAEYMPLPKKVAA